MLCCVVVVLCGVVLCSVVFCGVCDVVCYLLITITYMLERIVPRSTIKI